MIKYILTILIAITTGCIFYLSADDNSQPKLVKTEYFWLSGPSKSVDKLQRLYDIDGIAELVAQTINMPVVKGKITILNGWEFFDTCPRNAEACHIGNDIYLQSGYNISNVLGLTLAHEMAHNYTHNEYEAQEIACSVFPEYSACDNTLPEIK